MRLPYAVAGMVVAVAASAPPLSAAASSAAQVDAMAFVSATKDWVALDQGTRSWLVETMDGGKTWAERSLPPVHAAGWPRLEALHFSGSGSGQALVLLMAGACQATFKAYVTNDDGATWRSEGTLPGADGPTAVDGEVFDGGCATSGFAVSRRVGGRWRSVSNVAWVPRDMSAPPQALGLSGSEQNPLVSVAYVLPKGRLLHDYIRLYQHKAGAWQAVAVPVGGLAYARVSGILFTSLTQGYVAANGQVFETRDRGRHWARVPHVTTDAQTWPGAMTSGGSAVFVAGFSSTSGTPVMWEDQDGRWVQIYVPDRPPGGASA